MFNFNFRRTADVRSCGYIELFVLSKDDVMSSIHDYPDAQKILAKHGRKRLALGLKRNCGLRDETTSGSQSESEEIELKLTRPDSEKSFFTSPKSATYSDAHMLVDVDGEDTKLDLPNGISNMYLRSPNKGFYLMTPTQSTASLHPRSSITSQGNVIGPTSSLRSLENKSLLRLFMSSDEDVHRCIRNPWLAPKKANVRRSKSDMQRRKKSVYNSSRSVFSDGEKTPEVIHSPGLTHSRSFVRSNKFIDTEGEDKFLKSMKGLYHEAINSLKTRTVSKCI